MGLISFLVWVIKLMSYMLSLLFALLIYLLRGWVALKDRIWDGFVLVKGYYVFGVSVLYIRIREPTYTCNIQPFSIRT